MPTPTFDTLTNSSSTTLTAPFTVGDTYLTVKSVSGFSAPTRVTLFTGLSPLAETIHFIVSITAIDSVNKRLTIGSAKEGTTLKNLRTGTRVQCRLTAGHYEDHSDAILDLYSAGTQGPQGYQGAPGAQGTAGSAGSQGSTGAQGPQGNQGNQGFQGTAGSAGAQGNQGNQGSTGAQGPQGNQGNQGAAGSQGSQGANGSSSIGGSVGSGTTGSVLFVGSSSTLAQDNSNFFFDDTNNCLGINMGAQSPTRNLEVWSATSVPTIRLANGTSTNYPNNCLQLYAVDGNGRTRMESVRTGTIVYADSYVIENNYSEQQINMNRVISSSSAEKVGIQFKCDFDSTITGTASPVACQIRVQTDSATSTASSKKFLDCSLSGTSKFSVDLTGRVKIGTVTSDPSDTPASGTAVFNTANKKLWIYDGSGWVSTTLA